MGDPTESKIEPQAGIATHKPWQAWLRPRPLGVLIVAMLLLGVFLRVHAFGDPDSFLFDEHHFVENARNYLQHRPDWNDHPPLGKLIIAEAIEMLGDSSVGWRMPSLIFGLATVLFGGLASRRLFKSVIAGWLAAAFLSVDGFLISYARAALLDGYLAACLAIALFIATLPMSFGAVLAAGLITGFSASIKFSGIAVLLPFLLMVAFANIPRKKLAIYGLTFVMAMVGVYVSQYSRGLMLAMQPASPLDVFKDTQRLLDHHAALTDMKNPWTSGWVTWALPTKPVLLRYAQHMGEVRVLSGLGNLALWWPGILVTVAAIASILAKGVIAIVGPVSDDLDTSPSVSVSAFVQARGRSVLLLLSGCIGFLAPWVVTHRDSYIYHFLPCYLAIVLLLAGYVDWVRKRKPLDALIFVGVVLVVAAFYAPVWSSMAISAKAVQARLFLGSWR